MKKYMFSRDGQTMVRPPELIIVEQSVDGLLYWENITATIFPNRLYKAIFHSEKDSFFS